MEDKLKFFKDRGEWEQLEAFLESHLIEISNMPCTLPIYNVIKDAPIQSLIGKMMIAWLAFLNGDNHRAYCEVEQLEGEEIEPIQLQVFYDSLRALMLFRTEPEKKLQLAKEAAERLPKDECSIYIANAKLTYGQMLAGFLKYREAAKTFYEAYKLFEDLHLDFAASVALTNHYLNLYYLGEVDLIFKEGNETLIQKGDVQNQGESPYDMLYLPLGMSYFQIGKLNLACQYLNRAKSYIENTKLLHMQGVVEPFLMKGYYLLGEKEQMKALMEGLLNQLGHMHYIYTPLFKSMYYGLLEEERIENQTEMRGFIERLEEEFNQKQHHQGNYFILQVLLLLQEQGLTNCLTLDYISEMLSVTRFTGMRTQLQEFLIFLAEQNEVEGKREEVISCLKEALDIKKDTGIVVNFYLHSKKTAYRLKELDPVLYEKVKEWKKEEKMQEYILTSKEREILALVAEGKSNAEIGETLYITLGTVKWHMNHILSKLGVKNRTQAIIEARRLGEIT